MTPRISVVVPSYNHAAFVEQSLGSILRQTHPPAELLVIDDGSTDDSPRHIDRVLRQCPFPCELIARGHRGLCATLNEGLARTKAEYFAYLGSDDLWLPDFLRARCQLLEARSDAVLAYGHAYLIDDRNRIVDCTKDWAEYADGDARSMLLKTTAPMSPTVLYRRSVLQRHHWSEGAELEDYDLYLRLSAEGPFALDPRVLSAWRRHSANTSWNQQLMLNEQLKAQREAAIRFGYSDREIEALQRVTKFSRAEDFLRIGEKKEALRLMCYNLAGIRSFGKLTRLLLRLFIPFRLMQRRNAAAARRAHQSYGSIQI